EDMARRRGAVIVVASALPQTLDRISRWAAGLEGKGFALTPASALTLARPDRAARAP
ncbi:MAG: divergent polysaccharide deacetylase family protein, partial [Pseudomonadota bacterium]|nr:divergent polysaccharide deacetylase family protein [Pseudomonadota bacterium]